MKLKTRIVNWLFQDQLKELDQLKEEFKNKIIQVNEVKRNCDLILLQNKNILSGTKIIMDQCLDQEKRLENTVGNIGVAADVSLNKYDQSWAVVCVQGSKNDYIRFVELGHADVREIGHFLQNFEQRNVSCDLPHGFAKDLFFKI